MKKGVLNFSFRVVTLSTVLLATNAIVFPLYAQTDGTESVADIRARTSIQQTLKATSAKGVPVDALVGKIREGVSKRSDPEQIDAAVKTLAKRLEISHAALAPTFSISELSAGADALEVGVPASALRDFRKLWRMKPLTVPLGILYELVARDVPVTIAVKRIRELMDKGANDSQLARLSTQVLADVDAGLKPDAALELRAKGVMSLLSAPVGTATIIPSKPPIRPK